MTQTPPRPPLVEEFPAPRGRTGSSQQPCSSQTSDESGQLSGPQVSGPQVSGPQVSAGPVLQPAAGLPQVSAFRLGGTWSMLLLGVAVGFLGVHLVFVRPTLQQLDQLHREVGGLKRHLLDLSGQTARARQSDSLLAALVDQGRRASEATRAVAELQQLQDDLTETLATEQRTLQRGREALAKLADVQTRIWQTSRQTQDAAGALAQVTEIQQQLIDGQPLTDQAHLAWMGMTELRTRLLAYEDQTAPAFKVLETMNALRQRLIDQAADVPAAEGVLTQLAELTQDVAGLEESTAAARFACEQLAALPQEVIACGATQQEAAEVFQQMTDLIEQAANQDAITQEARQVQNDLMSLRDVTLAEASRLSSSRRAVEEISLLCHQVSAVGLQAVSAAGELSAVEELQQRLLENREVLEAAHQTAQHMADLNHKLANTSSSLAAGEETASRLIQLKDKLLNQNDTLIPAVETLELAGELQRQYAELRPAFEDIRRWMGEVLLLRPSFEQTVQMLRPLTELGQLRRLAPAEFRQAARVILRSRATELARSPAPAPLAGQNSPKPQERTPVLSQVVEDSNAKSNR